MGTDPKAGLIRILSSLVTATAALYCVSIFASAFFLPLLLLVPASVFLRSRWMYVVTLPPLIIFLSLFGGRFVPRIGRADTGGTTLRVMTFNQLFLNTNVNDLLAAIRGQRADIVAVQELVPPVADAMQRDLKGQYPYQILTPSNSVGGLGVLSRYPLERATGVDGAAGQWVVVRVGGQTLTVANVHVHFSGISRLRSQRFGSLPYFRLYDTSGRLSQVTALRQAARQIRGGLIMMGDFNTGDREPGHAVLASELHDAFAEAGTGFGAPCLRPREL